MACTRETAKSGQTDRLVTSFECRRTGSLRQSGLPKCCQQSFVILIECETQQVVALVAESIVSDLSSTFPQTGRGSTQFQGSES
jgi:hypothetical protein